MWFMFSMWNNLSGSNFVVYSIVVFVTYSSLTSHRI